jgi:hypothetical protein
MLLPIAFVLGALFGWRRAVRRGGDRLDRLQYAAVHGILFTLIALTTAIVLQRAGVI